MGIWEQSEGDVSSSVAARVALGAVSIPRRSVTGSFGSKQPVEIVTSAAYPFGPSSSESPTLGKVRTLPIANFVDTAYQRKRF
jgi:hypothetical protein